MSKMHSCYYVTIPTSFRKGKRTPFLAQAFRHFPNLSLSGPLASSLLVVPLLWQRIKSTEKNKFTLGWSKLTGNSPIRRSNGRWSLRFQDSNHMQ